MRKKKTPEKFSSNFLSSHFFMTRHFVSKRKNFSFVKMCVVYERKLMKAISTLWHFPKFPLSLSFYYAYLEVKTTDLRKFSKFQPAERNATLSPRLHKGSNNFFDNTFALHFSSNRFPSSVVRFSLP